MPRIPLVPPDPEDEATGAVFARIRGEGRELTPLVRTLAHAPKMLDAWLNMAWPLRFEATTPRALRELIIMRNAQIERSHYEWASHWPHALASGVTEEQMRSLSKWRTSDAFSEVERAVLAYAEELAQRDVSDEVFAKLASLFHPKEIIELTLTATFYTNVSIMIQALQIEVNPVHRQFLLADESEDW